MTRRNSENAVLTIEKMSGRGLSLVETVGNTPLVRLTRVGAPVPGVELCAKLEGANPGGSVKDRAALYIIQDGEKRGGLTREQTLIDATSGNTGIAYAMLGAALGYRVELVMPANVSRERIQIARAYGATVTLSDPLEGSDGAIRKTRELVAASPEKYFYADQYNNPANVRAHYETTGAEIIEQTQGRVTHLVAGIGTSGTLMGTGRRLKEYDPRIQVVAVEPADELQAIEGLKHMATAIVPGIYDATFPDRKMLVRTEDAYHMTRRLAREEGLFVGFSSGAACHAALELARETWHGVIVVIFPDGGDKYLSTRLWE